jgi:hypothetical protein
MPLTTENRSGFMLRATRGRARDADLIVLPRARGADGFEACSIGPVGIYPCIGGRDAAAAQRLEAALNGLRRRSRFAQVPVAALRRGEPGAGDMEKAWYYGPGFWLERTDSA